MLEEKNSILNLKFSPLELELREYAKENNVPIIFDEGLAFLEMIIRLYQPKVILEIGTAIGYSAIRMHEISSATIYTIERNDEMYAQAVENIKKAGYEKEIHVLHKDALEAFDDLSDIKIDMLFIDAAKAQYLKFFDLYTPLLNSKGIVVCDNMLFHGLVENKEEYESYSRSLRGLVRKLSSFHEALLNNEGYTTSIFDIGDGMSISVKKD